MSCIIVASTNPVKIQAVRQGFLRLFPQTGRLVEGVSAPSGVNVQPMTDEETLRGALNRAAAARQARPQADYWFGLEGGISEQSGDLLAFAWVAAVARQSGGQVCGRARTGAFLLPPAVARLVRQGLELGEADDIVFGVNNSKQAGGAVGLLTGGALDRAALYEPAVVLALIPFTNPGLYR